MHPMAATATAAAADAAAAAAAAAIGIATTTGAAHVGISFFSIRVTQQWHLVGLPLKLRLTPGISITPARTQPAYAFGGSVAAQLPTLATPATAAISRGLGERWDGGSLIRHSSVIVESEVLCAKASSVRKAAERIPQS